ncbi:MAG: zinc ribbon domain-containing protein, partial [Actinobacteria bacterium]|nr:zinc ribbon domain-containing protein [Actinomycetota bacterium]
AAYRTAEERYAGALRERSAAATAAAAVRPAAEEARKRQAERYDGARRREELITFLLRLAVAAASFVVGVVLLSLLRRRNSRYLPLAGAVVALGAVLALVVTGDYVTDYFDPFELGLLLLSLSGAAITLVAFWTLQRYLRRRLPQRRVRRRQCPFCGFLVGEGEHCEGCGRAVVAACARCSAPRRVGTRFCRACGEA